MPFGHKAGLPPSKKYLLMRQPRFQKWKLLPDGRDFVKINGSDLHSLVLIHLI